MVEHPSWEEHKAWLSKFEQLIPIGSKWTHRKKPDALYTVCDLVIDEATDMVSVIYERNWVRFARLAEIFLEDVDCYASIHNDVEYHWPRFTRIQ